MRHYLLLYINRHIETLTGDRTYAIADNIYAIGDIFTSPIVSFLFYHKCHYSLGLYDSEICHRHFPRTVWSYYDTITLSHEYSHDIIQPLFPLCTLVLNLPVDSSKCSSFGVLIVYPSPQLILESIILILLHCRKDSSSFYFQLTCSPLLSIVTYHSKRSLSFIVLLDTGLWHLL